MYTPLYSAGGVYVPHTMYMQVHHDMMPLRSGTGYVGPTQAAAGTTTSGMLYYTPHHNLIAAQGGIPYGGAYPVGGMGSPSLSGMGGGSMGNMGDGPAQMRKLFIGGLNHETTDEQLKEYYSQWGTVVDCIVIRDPATKHSRGFGFVTYATISMAETAMAERPHTINGKVVDPKRAIPREQMLPMTANNPPYFLEPEPPTGCKLTLSGIHWDFHTVDDLRQYFEKFGDVEQVEIVGQPRGYGFVVYEDKEGVEKCLANNKVHLINGRKIEVKECLSLGPNDSFAQRKTYNNLQQQQQQRSSHQQSSSLASHGSSNCTPESSVHSNEDQLDPINFKQAFPLLDGSMEQMMFGGQQQHNLVQNQLFGMGGMEASEENNMQFASANPNQQQQQLPHSESDLDIGLS